MNNHINNKTTKMSCCHSSNNSPNMRLQKFWADILVYKPLIIILIFCLLIPFAQIHPFDADRFMHYFMGYFFIFLSLFKFFDLKGFVKGFSTYDLVARQFSIYGYAYPFIELFLGIAYLTQSNLLLTNGLTFVIMLASGIGVLKSVLSGHKLKCACLGTILNAPLSTVSILENFGMGFMAAYQLIFFL